MTPSPYRNTLQCSNHMQFGLQVSRGVSELGHAREDVTLYVCVGERERERERVSERVYVCVCVCMCVLCVCCVDK